MSFEAFNNDDVQKILDHILACMPEEKLSEQIEKYRSEEKYKAHLAGGFTNEQAVVDVIKWYGSKEKAMEAVEKLAENYKRIFCLDNAKYIAKTI